MSTIHLTHWPALENTSWLKRGQLISHGVWLLCRKLYSTNKQSRVSAKMTGNNFRWYARRRPRLLSIYLCCWQREITTIYQNIDSPQLWLAKLLLRRRKKQHQNWRRSKSCIYQLSEDTAAAATAVLTWLEWGRSLASSSCRARSDLPPTWRDHLVVILTHAPRRRHSRDAHTASPCDDDVVAKKRMTAWRHLSADRDIAIKY